ncbi:hypothetical protein [Dyella sp.]|uniref:hypothetical protein n=1 Tax=Dyella sp. TaxID=1869338 RepID=UPI002D792B05|nr:hypothetical protein [Dyella sp.]HET7332586.1 hypothetical protein [Dyella sp.]
MANLLAETLWKMKFQKIMLSLVLLMLGTSCAEAACSNWLSLAANPDYRLIYTGKVGDRPIRMMLHLNTAGGRLDGAYGYNNQSNMLTLAGIMLPNYEDIDLDEHDEKGVVTGHFHLKFFHARPAWESEESYEKENKDSCSFLTGEWRSTAGNKTFDVTLQQVGVSAPADDNWRNENEITAYKLRKAMLEEDRKTFASLLHYPFQSEGDHHISNIWNNAEDVIKNYRSIVHFTAKQIQESVPHALQTSGTRSQFINRSVYLERGKVIQICAEACPVMP